MKISERAAPQQQGHNGPKRIVTEQQVHDAVAFLIDSAVAMGEAKGETVRTGHRLKTVEAIQTVLAEGAMNLRQAKARASKEYQDAVAEDVLSAARFEELKSRRSGMEMLIETWRSEQANYRAVRL